MVSFVLSTQPNMYNKKTMLVIMDGWGIGAVEKNDAIRHARTPFVSSLYEKFSHTTLTTCGEEVGLPDGQMGNSEVGHLNLGAGRIVYQELQRINVAIREGSFQKNPVLIDAIEYAKTNNKTLHLIGLVSDGGVHSHLHHLKTILNVCYEQNCTQVCVHAFTDGRDTDPASGYGFLNDLQVHLDKTTGVLASITGRYYAMDRDKRWERVKLAYDALVLGKGTTTKNMLQAVKDSYDNGVTDEFIKPILLEGLSYGKITEGDAVICFNFRTDRCREITEVLTQKDFPEHDMKKLNVHYSTMTVYDHHFTNVQTLFQNEDLTHTLGEELARHHKTQLRMAETEKYPHVSFFFSGGREQPFEGERRIMIPSPKVATYDLQPEMSAIPLTDAVVNELNTSQPDFICLNYANPDMVGHTGVWEAIIKAVETVDQCVERTVTAALQHGYTVFLTADHGNADYAINEDGSPNTAHSLNPVPLFVIDSAWKGKLKPGKLGDIAPTLLQWMGLPIPKEMTGKILID
jgi:2,3-bisphosphoglycerate-independent phosphoglycerate mutase